MASESPSKPSSESDDAEPLCTSSAEAYNLHWINEDMYKYYRQRYQLFSLYDRGVLMDRESWYSVTPEKIAMHHSQVLKCDTILDGFGGCGGNTIQFAKTCRRVVSVEIDPIKIHLAKTNAEIYGVRDKILFVEGDYFDVVANMSTYFPDQVDQIFLSPPWGGPEYLKGKYDVFSMMDGIGLPKILQVACQVSRKVAVLVPRNTPVASLLDCGRKIDAKRCHVEYNYLDKKLKSITAYYDCGECEQ